MKKKEIYNLTQHEVSERQRQFQIVEIEDKEYIKSLLTFDHKPSQNEIECRAKGIAEYAEEIGARKVLIGGAPYLMSSLIEKLEEKGIIPYYAYSERKSVDEVLDDGRVVKHSIFDMTGLIRCIFSKK